MATSGASEDAFSGRPNYVLKFQVNRLSASGTTNRWRLELNAIKRSGATSFDLTARPWSVGGSFEGGGSWVPDFRNTDVILLWRVDTDKATSADGYSNISWSASAGPAGIFGSATTSGSFAADRIPQVPDTPPRALLDGARSTQVTIGLPATGGSGGAAIIDYTMQLASNSNFSSPIASRGMAPDDRQQVVVDLKPNTTYYVRHRARNSVGSSDWSPTLTVKTLVGSPSEPRNVHTENPGPSSLTIDWDAPESFNGGALTGYVVKRATDSKMTANLTEYSVGPSVTALTVDGLAPSTPYWFLVIAVNSAGRGLNSTTVSGTTISGAYVSNGTAWKGAGIFVSDGAAWAPATIAVSQDGAWISAV